MSSESHLQNAVASSQLCSSISMQRASPPVRAAWCTHVCLLSSTARTFAPLASSVATSGSVQPAMCCTATESTLSPPGRGYDCFRTWQALAVGTVPLVPEDPAYDARLLELGQRRLPPPKYSVTR